MRQKIYHSDQNKIKTEKRAQKSEKPNIANRQEKQKEQESETRGEVLMLKEGKKNPETQIKKQDRQEN